MALADLESVLGRRVDRLSGGQAQRVRFAAAIAGDRQLLLLDEPTSVMDAQARRNFWAQIHGFAARGRTVLFATHYLQEADDAADRVIVVADGRKIVDGPPGAIKARFGDRQVRFTLRDRPPCFAPWPACGRRSGRPGSHPAFRRHRRHRGLAGRQRAEMVGPGSRRRRPGRHHSCG